MGKVRPAVCGAPSRGVGVMRQLTIVVKPFRAEAVLNTLAELGVDSCIVREAKGYSRQKGYLDRYLGSEYSMAFLPKVEITACVADDRAEEVVRQVARTARTGRMGDGKIFVLPVDWPEAIEF
jgi:nitrogen regulatory protein PII